MEGEDWDVSEVHFVPKHINDRMLIEDLVRWRRYNVTLENSDNMVISW